MDHNQANYPAVYAVEHVRKDGQSLTLLRCSQVQPCASPNVSAVKTPTQPPDLLQQEHLNLLPKLAADGARIWSWKLVYAQCQQGDAHDNMPLTNKCASEPSARLKW